MSKLLLLSFLACAMLMPSLPGIADTETIIRTTSTTTSVAPVVLPATGSYLVMDPVTGLVWGSYDPISRLVNGRTLVPGVVIVDSMSHRFVATVDSAGNVVDVAVTPAPSSLLSSIDARRKELDDQITVALSKGQITPEQATAFHNDLARIEADEIAASTGTGIVTFEKAIALGYGLNTIESRLITPSTIVIKPVVAPQIVVRSGQLILVDDVTFRRGQLEKRIDDEYAAGRLSNSQVAQLKSDLTKIASLDTKYRQDGVLSESKAKTLEIRLDQVQSRLDQDIAIINQKRLGMGIRVD